MTQIDSYETLSALLSKQLRRGVRTNAFTDPAIYRREIAAGTLFVEDMPGGLVILHDHGHYQRVNFYLHDAAGFDFVPQKPSVLEIALRPQDTALADTIAFWNAMGFMERFCRHRRMRPANAPILPAICPMTVSLAGMADAKAARRLLCAAFDPVAGCLPTADELQQILTDGDMLKVQPDFAGLLHFSTGRTGTEIRHLAVREDCRGKGAAQNLMTTFLEKTGNAKSIVWVRTGNIPAENFYAKNNYVPDGWISTVLYYE